VALVIKDRVKETCTGTNGDMALAGAVSGFVAFDIDATFDGNTTYYAIEDADGTKWEVGLGTLSADSTSIVRTTILATQVSLTDTTRQTFSGGAHTIFCTYPAGKAVHLDASGNLSHTVDISADTNLAAGTGITLTGDSLSTTDGDIVHDNLSGFVANEHLDWTASVGTIHAGNYTDTVYTLPEATTTAKGGIELFSDTDQSVAATAVSTTASRTYGLQLNAAGQGVVNVPWVDTNTTYTVGDGGLTTNDFTDADHSKLNAIEASADVTDATNVTAAGALMDSELAGIAAVKATTGTFLTADQTKLDGIAASANNYTLPSASVTVVGGVELATTGETTTGTDTARAVTPAGVQAAIDALIGGAPGALDTLNELAAAIGDDASYASTITTALGLKATLASPTFTGTIAIPNVANLETAVVANTAKVTNATHTGDVTGGTALTIATDAVDIAMLSATGTASSSTFLRGDNTWVTPTDTNTQLSEEQVEDFVGGMLGGTETLITVTYQDATGDIDFVVDNDLSNYDNSSSGFITAALTEEQVEDFVGGMLGGTETGITVTYQDATHDIDFVVADTTVAGDSGSTAMTPGDTLTIAGGTNVTTAMSGDTLTITSTDTNTTYTKASFDLDHLFTLVDAAADTSEHLGTFTGGTISDSVTIKAALQALETAVETKGVTAGSSSIVTVGTIGTGTWQGTAIATAYIADDAITGAKIALFDDSLAATTTHFLIADGTDYSSFALSGDVTCTNAGVVTVADDAIDSEHYTDGSIDHVHLAADCIDGDNIQDDVINSEHIAAASIDNEHLADDAVDSDELAAGAIDTAHIGDAQVTYAKIQNVSATNIILGRDSASAGVIEEISPANLLTMLGVEASATADQTAGEILTLLEDGIDSVHYKDGSIDNEHIADDAIDSEHYAAASIDFAHIQNIAANSILGRNANSSGVLSEIALTTTQILIGDGTGFTAAALSGDVAMTNAGVVSLAANSVDSDQYVDGSIDNAHLADDAVGTAEIADDAITSALIADDAIVSAAIADDAVLTAHIADDQITAALMADNSIDSDMYVDGSIDTAHIGDLQVTTAKIAADAITGAKIADDAIDSEHYTDGSIDNAHIADDAIDSEHYAAGSIDTAHIADDQITLAKMAGITRGSIIIGDASGDPAALAIGSSTYVLTSDGTDIAWASGGDITAVVAGAGMTGGATSGSATVNVIGGDGITANANDVAVTPAQTTITSLLAADIKIGEDDQTKIDFETADEIHFYAANVEQVYLADNIFGPQADSDVDLGTTGVRWKDAYIDTITTTGAVFYPIANAEAEPEDGTVTIDLRKANYFDIELGANVTNINLLYGKVGQRFMIRFEQDASANYSIAWNAVTNDFDGDGSTVATDVSWPGGTAPTMTATNDKADTYGLVIRAEAEMDGFVIGQNMPVLDN